MAPKNGSSAEAILNSALKVISRLGYADASVGAIAADAAVNTVTVYRLFEGKEKLFREVITRYSAVDFPAADLDARLAGLSGDEAMLAAMADEYFAVVFGHIGIIRIFVVESPHFDFVRERAWYLPPPVFAHCRRCFGRLESAEGVARGMLDRMAEMFVTHIVRRAMEYNKHDSIWNYDAMLAADFSRKIAPQIDLLCRLMQLAGGRVPAVLMKEEGE